MYLIMSNSGVILQKKQFYQFIVMLLLNPNFISRFHTTEAPEGAGSLSQQYTENKQLTYWCWRKEYTTYRFLSPLSKGVELMIDIDFFFPGYYWTVLSQICFRLSELCKMSTFGSLQSTTVAKDSPSSLLFLTILACVGSNFTSE